MSSLQICVSEFLTTYLMETRSSSPQTQKTYRECFSQLFRFLYEKRGIKPLEATFDDIGGDTIPSFLHWLEDERGCKESTRNLRLATLKSFCSYLQFKAPDQLSLCTDVHRIKNKPVREEGMKYLSEEAVSAILTAAGDSDLRHLAILQLAYDSAARASEICTLPIGKLELRSPKAKQASAVHLYGKGAKKRTVPIMPQTSGVLRLYIKRYRGDASDKDPLFCGRGGSALSSEGLNYILSKYVEQARRQSPGLFRIKVSAHTLRHSKATHMLQNGVPLVTISEILGHESIQTTQKTYAEVTPSMKVEALQKASSVVLPSAEHTPSREEELLDWFKTKMF